MNKRLGRELRQTGEDFTSEGVIAASPWRAFATALPENYVTGKIALPTKHELRSSVRGDLIANAMGNRKLAHLALREDMNLRGAVLLQQLEESQRALTEKRNRDAPNTV